MIYIMMLIVMSFVSDKTHSKHNISNPRPVATIFVVKDFIYIAKAKSLICSRTKNPDTIVFYDDKTIVKNNTVILTFTHKNEDNIFDTRTIEITINPNKIK